MKKKILAVLLAAGMTLSLAGCGGAKETAAESMSAEQPAEKEEALEEAAVEKEEAAGEAPKEDAAIEELQTALNELADALDGTCWVGMDAEDYSCYVMAFEGDQAAIYSNVEGDEGVEGYWNISAENLYLYDDAECTNMTMEIPWEFDEENEVLILNERAVLTQVEGDLESAAEIMQQEALAAQAAEFLDSTVWAGADTDYSMAMAFTFKDGQYYMGIMDTEGNTEEHTGSWSMDYDSIYLFDENGEALDSLSWDMAEDGSELYIVVDSSQIAFGLVQTEVDGIEEALVAIAEELLVQ